MTPNTQRAFRLLAHEIAHALMTNSLGDRAKRLQLYGPEEENFGTRNLKSVVEKIMEVLTR